MDLLPGIADALLATVLDVLPLVAVLVVFQIFVLRRPLPRRTLIGAVYVVIGLALFLVGLEEALFPLGRAMARQLTDAQALGPESSPTDWANYGWVYAFAAAIGFATTIAEPALIAVARKAEAISAGAIPARGLRVAVAIGVAVGVAVGCYRIIAGIPIVYFILSGYAVVVVQTWCAPRMIVPLAYDTGGVTTSTVTVPVVTALGLGLASAIPGRDPLIDGFGLIAFASLFPIMSVLAYASLAQGRRLTRKSDPPRNVDPQEAP